MTSALKKPVRGDGDDGVHPYKVQFYRPDTGSKTFGLVEVSGDRADDAMEHGLAIVSHALTPAQFRIRLSNISDIHFPNRFDYIEGYGIVGNDKYHQYIFGDMVLAKRAERTLPVDRLRLGHTFFLRADRDHNVSTHYLVTGIDGDECTIEWRGWHPMHYPDRNYGWGGQFPVGRILPLVKISRDRIEFEHYKGLHSKWFTQC